MTQRFALLLAAAAVTLVACREDAEFEAFGRASEIDQREVDFRNEFPGMDATFLVLDPNRSIRFVHNPGRAAQALIPASTFKIPNAIIGLETGAIPDGDFRLAWDSVAVPREAWWPSAWTETNTPASAFRNSVVWYFQEVARRIGEPRMRRYLRQFAYGNGDLSAGIDRFWLEGNFAVSAEEQVEFLRRFYTGELNISEETNAAVREMMFLGEEDGLRLFGKTGTGRLPEGRLVAWLVGFAEAQGRTRFYALNVTGDASAIWRDWPGERRMAWVREMLIRFENDPAAASVEP